MKEQNDKNKVIVYSKSYCPYCASVRSCTHLLITPADPVDVFPPLISSAMPDDVLILQVKALFKDLNVNFKLIELDELGRPPSSLPLC